MLEILNLKIMTDKQNKLAVQHFLLHRSQNEMHDDESFAIILLHSFF